MRIRSVFILCLLVLMAPAAHAETLSWKDCISEAARSNPSVRSSRSGVDAAHFQTKSAYGNFFPQISGDLNYSNGATSTNVPGTLTPSSTGVTSGGSHPFYSASIQGTQNLFNGFADKAKIDEGKANEGVAGASLDIAKAQASYDLKSAFATLQYGQAELKLAHDIAKRRKDNKDMVELRFESGQENKGSLLLSEANLKDAQFGIVQAKDDIHVAQQQLAQVLGRERSHDLRVSGTIPLSSPPPSKDLSKIMRGTPQYRKSIGLKKAAKAGVVSARSAFFPDLNLTAAVGRQGDTFFPEGNRWSVGANVTLPFFNGGRDFYNLKSAKANEAAADFNQQSTETQVRSDLARAYAAYVESVERLKTDQSFLRAATTRAEIARAQYNNGLLSFQDWDIIENDLIARQKAYLQSRKNRIIAEAGWEQVQGKGVFP